MAGIVLSILGTAVLAAALWLGTRWLYGYCRMIYYIGRIPKPTPNGHWLFGHIFEVLHDALTPARIHCTHAHQARKTTLPHAHRVHAPTSFFVLFCFVFPILYAATSLSVHHDQDDRTEPFDRPRLDGDLGWPVH